MGDWACAVDWPQPAGVLKNLALAAAAVVTAVVAVRGFSKWRSEDRGKADFDLTRRALKALTVLNSLQLGHPCSGYSYWAPTPTPPTGAQRGPWGWLARSARAWNLCVQQ